MNILHITSSFPHPDNGGTIYTDLAEALQQAGHSVTVAVIEQSKNITQSIMSKERGMDVTRIVTGNIYDVGFIEKGITFLKMPFLMRQGIAKFLGNRKFDLILFEAPPVTNADLVKWAKKKFGCPAYLIMKDIFPQNAVDIGIMKKNDMVYHYFKHIEKKLYQTADKIGCMSQANINYLLTHEPWMHPDKLELFPNTKKIADNYGCSSTRMRDKLGIPKDACVFLFGGNMGRPQYIDFLCEAIVACKEDRKLFFLFVGRGTDRYKLEKTINEHNITNAKLVDNLPRDEYEQISKECDVGLIVLDKRFTIPNYPSRILTYLEYAKPVLAATDKNTDIKELITDCNCGDWVWSGDVDAFVSKAKAMAMSHCLNELGQNGRKYMEAHFQVSRSVEVLERFYKTTKAKKCTCHHDTSCCH